MSAGLPYPRGPLSMISGAMYCNVPRQTNRNTQADVRMPSFSGLAYMLSGAGIAEIHLVNIGFGSGFIIGFHQPDTKEKGVGIFIQLKKPTKEKNLSFLDCKGKLCYFGQDQINVTYLK